VFPLYLDEDSLTRALVRGLRAQGVDVVTAAEAGTVSLKDEEQLSFAAQQSRAIYTANLTDFVRLHGVWLRAGRHHAGVIVLTDQRTPIGVQIRALVRLVNTHSLETMRDRMEFLSNWTAEA
jgi:hypothetical protein